MTVGIGLQDQLGARIHGQGLLCRGLLLARREVGEGAGNRDLLSLAAHRNRLAVGLQQMKRLARFLYEKQRYVRQCELRCYLHDK